AQAGDAQKGQQHADHQNRLNGFTHICFHDDSPVIQTPGGYTSIIPQCSGGSNRKGPLGHWRKGERISPALVKFARAYPSALERQTAGYRQAVVLESFGDRRIAKPFWPKGRHNKKHTKGPGCSIRSSRVCLDGGLSGSGGQAARMGPGRGGAVSLSP